MKFFVFIIIGISLQGCLTTYYGTAPKSIENEIMEFKVFWNFFCNESHVKEKFELKVDELMNQSNDYKTYLILYQSNNSLKTGQRKFIIHFFENEEKKSQFVKMTNEKENDFITLLESESFKKSWASLKKGLRLEDTFRLFPELKNYYLRQEFEYESHMIYRLQNLEFIFDKNGRLLTWRKQ